AGIPRPVPSPALGAAARGPLGRLLALDSLRREIPPTHWKEGALLGGGALGLGFALLAAGFCGNSDVGGGCGGAVTGGFVVGAGLGVIIGALVGGQFPKERRDGR
ncbi:MAG: hypothetical protein M3477_09305, partial [Gemmatimonadota bacterium]|nr:hypothetical protein [Gemmatimonadota bacterium]